MFGGQPCCGVVWWWLEWINVLSTGAIKRHFSFYHNLHGFAHPKTYEKLAVYSGQARLTVDESGLLLYTRNNESIGNAQ
jgi:hypothetical protein